MRRPNVPFRVRWLAAAVVMLSAIGLACSKEESAKQESVTGVTVARRAPAPERAMMVAPPSAAPAPGTDAPADNESSSGFAMTAERADTTSARPASFGRDASAMLIRTGTASVQVDSLAAGIARVREVARRVGGVVANVDMETGNDQNRSASLELRIPSDRFDDAVSGLTPIGKVEAVNVSVEDVGEEFVDVTARMANARKLEDRLVQLLAARTGKLGDVLMVERELARVREEIERYEGRIRYLGARTATSRLTVTIHEPLPLVATHPGEHPILDAFKQAWRNFVAVVAGIVASLGVVIPLGAIALGAWLLLRRRLVPATAKREA